MSNWKIETRIKNSPLFRSLHKWPKARRMTVSVLSILLGLVWLVTPFPGGLLLVVMGFLLAQGADDSQQGGSRTRTAFRAICRMPGRASRLRRLVKKRNATRVRYGRGGRETGRLRP